VLGILSKYVRIKNGEAAGDARVHIFAGRPLRPTKLAKQIIKLINITASFINNDPPWR